MYLIDTPGSNMCIDFGGFTAFVTHHTLDIPKVSPVLEAVCGKCLPERMHGYLFFNPGFDNSITYHILYAPWRRIITFCAFKQKLFRMVLILLIICLCLMVLTANSLIIAFLYSLNNQTVLLRNSIL